ncbi:MAG: DUF1800 domain-containing protein [Pirellulaceae bacterium]
MKLDAIDPQWAWEPWEPTAVESWDTARIAALYRRAAFCASPKDIQAAQTREPQEVVDGLFAEHPQHAQFEEESSQITSAVRASGDIQQLSTWWLHRMLLHPQPLVEKLTLFWHGHFATGAEKVQDVELMLQQNQLLREHALGDFRTMVHGIAKDPAMLIYLDSVTNRKAHANENFARELMELFCLGEGNYTEQDVQELARCFTGWEIRRKQFRFNRYQHDGEAKHVLGKQVEAGEEAIDQVLSSKHLPYFITYKLFKFFVCDEPSPPRALLEPLARQFASDNLSLRGTLRTMLGSRLLMSNWSAGRKVRSPVEMAVGMLRSLAGTTNLIELSRQLREVGQAVFFPPNVKGWDGGRAWVNSSTLVGRANLVHHIVRDENTRFAGGELSDMLRSYDATQPEKMLTWIAERFLAVPLSTQQSQTLLASLEDKPAKQASRELLSLLAALPQFHLA